MANRCFPYVKGVLILLIIFLGAGCLDKNRLAERTRLMNIVSWLTTEGDDPAPSHFDYIRIQYHDSAVIISHNNDHVIRQLRQTLVPDRVQTVVTRTSNEVHVGSLELYSNKYSYKVKIYSEKNTSTLCLAIGIPGDRGGASMLCLPGVESSFDRLIKELTQK